MKTILILALVFLVTAIVAVNRFIANHTTSHSTSFSLVKTKSVYKVKVTYNRDYARALNHYIDSCMQPAVIFGNSDKIDKDVITPDNTAFHIEAKPGYFYLVANKRDNSRAALDKLLNICTGIRDVIRPD